MKQVLIAHQSTIPHYRVAFYEAVQRLKPSWWDFGVVFDENPERRRRLFIEPIDASTFGFNTLPVTTHFFEIRGLLLHYQTFVGRVGQYDLVVLEDALRNLSYPMARLWRLRGIPVAYWGHGKDLRVAEVAGLKRLIESLKRYWIRRCEGFFAYTEGIKNDLVEMGVESSKIHVLNNTIDILAERSSFEALMPRRDALRRETGLSGRKVLLFVGRLVEGKRLDFLAEAFETLRRRNPEYHLVIIGGGKQSMVDMLRQRLGGEGVTFCGVLIDRARLAEWYVRSDAYVNPGDVGLGVVQSLCYDLTPVVIQRATHNPEYEYLSELNSVVVRAHASPEDYGEAVLGLCSDQTVWENYRARAWPSIKHLTIDRMASRFIKGVNQILS